MERNSPFIHNSALESLHQSAGQKIEPRTYLSEDMFRYASSLSQTPQIRKYTSGEQDGVRKSSNFQLFNLLNVHNIPPFSWSGVPASGSHSAPGAGNLARLLPRPLARPLDRPLPRPLARPLDRPLDRPLASLLAFLDTLQHCGALRGLAP
jgi:hypothetical protein